jgi:phage shock protein A
VNDNPNNTGTTRDAQLEQELGGLRRQYEQLREKQVRTEQDIANLTSQLETLKARAQAEYGTSDPEELQRLLARKREENEQVVAAYREHIQHIQADLATVERGVDQDG